MNISITAETYERLQRLKRAYGFGNTCELVVAVIRLLLDRVDAAANRRYELPDDDGKYIDEMFDELGHAQRTPDGDAPVRRHSRKLR